MMIPVYNTMYNTNSQNKVKNSMLQSIYVIIVIHRDMPTKLKESQTQEHQQPLIMEM